MQRDRLTSLLHPLTLSAATVGAVALLAATGAAQFTFEPPLAAETGALAWKTCVGDVNEDGHVDLISNHLLNLFGTLFVSAPTLCLGLGDGDGKFGPPQSLPSGRAFRLADFDADGHLDLLVALGGPANNQAVSILLGHGDGSFGPSIGISNNNSGQDPDDATVADFNGDGALDVAVHRGLEPFLNGRIMVIFGHGDGSFDPPMIVVPFVGMDTGHSGQIEAGDVNGDGRQDLVYTTGHSSPVLLGQGDGTFVFGPCFGADCGITTDRDFVLADVNGDGRDDAISNQRVLPAQADGSFGTGQVFPAAFAPFAVAVGDLDGDGIGDVVLGRNGTAAEFDASSTLGDVLILRGNGRGNGLGNGRGSEGGNGRGLGDGSFQTPGVVVSHVPQPRGLTLADIDVDGRLDIVVAEFQNFEATRTLFNRAYGPGSPFLDLGGALAGSNGYPIQIADGTLLGGQPFSFRLAGGPHNGAGFHVVGLDPLGAPFKGGTMIPSLDLINGPFQLDFIGGLDLAGAWPAGASGLTLYLQYWMPNGGGPQGFVATSGVRAQIP